MTTAAGVSMDIRALPTPSFRIRRLVPARDRARPLDEAEMAARKASVPKDLKARVRQAFDGDPALSWDAAVANVARGEDEKAEATK